MSIRLNELDKSKLSLGIAEQVAREYGGEGDIRIEGEEELAPPKGTGRGHVCHRKGSWGRVGAPFIGVPFLPRPANHPNPFSSFDFRFGLGGGLGPWGGGLLR